MNRGDKFSQEFIVTKGVQNDFISLFHDANPLHTDAAFAISKGFGGVVMHGNILGGFLSYFIGECLPVKNVIIHSQEIKYVNPVYMNEILVLQAEVNDVFESVNVVEFKFSFSKKERTLTVARGKIQIGII